MDADGRMTQHELDVVEMTALGCLEEWGVQLYNQCLEDDSGRKCEPGVHAAQAVLTLAAAMNAISYRIVQSHGLSATQSCQFLSKQTERLIMSEWPGPRTMAD